MEMKRALIEPCRAEHSDRNSRIIRYSHRVARLIHVFVISLAFAAGAAANESAFLKNVRQLTFEGKRSGEGYFSPDGKHLIFQSEREADNPFYQIYVLDLESGETHRVSPGIGKTTCAFFRPNSDEVLFASTHHDPEAKAKQKAELEFRASGKERRYSWDYDHKMDIFSCKRDGTGLKRLTDAPGYDAEGAYSPDGTKIVFCSLRHAPQGAVDPSAFGEIYIMNADGSNQRRLTSTPGYDGGPFFSPDGQRIIWRRFDEKGVVADVYTMKLDGSDVRRLTDFGAMSWAPYYHPSGKYVIFTSNKLGFSNFELYLVDAQGGEPTRVTHTDGFDGLPVFSPDGKKLCWTSSRTADGKSQLFFADWVYNDVARASSPAGSGGVSPQFSSEIALDDLKHQIAFLASDELEGRMTGSKGSQRAADYIADYLRSVGISPTFQRFEFTAGVQVVTNKNHLTVNGSAFTVEKDFRPLSFTDNNQVEGDTVFVGYGLKVPGKEGYDSYSGLNVSNKVVIALRYVPEDVTAERRQELNRYAALRYKAMIAREHGAKAILFVTGPNSPNPGELAGLNFDSTQAGSGIVAASISSNAARAFLPDLKSAQTALDKEDPHTPGGFALTNVHVKISTAIERVRKDDRNVLGFLHGKSAEYIIVGGHYDHLGFGESGAMQRKGEENQIHNGADDNASGIAAIMELAGTLAKATDRQRGVLFAFWSGEEIGLVGSSYFAEHPTLPLSNAIAYLNFDMVGRLKDNKLLLQGIGSSAAWKRLIEKRNVAAGFNTVLQEDPYLPTDTTAFYPKGVPVLSFFTGSHDDYHRPTDDADKLDYDGLLRITKFANGIISDLLKGPDRLDYVKVERSSSGGSRENLRAYLGTIPDYATEVAGVKISGVRGGSPADKGGLKGGDVIVEFAGQKIANIYDYTYALDAVKIGQPVVIAVMREGKRVVLNVTPEARK